MTMDKIAAADLATGLAVDIADLKARLAVAVTHKPGALRLDAWPLLVYAPTQHGPGVRTEDRGVAVADIVVKAAEVPDYDRLAEHFDTTAEHVRQAIDYATATATARPEG